VSACLANGEATKASQNAIYAANKAACEADKSRQKTQCESTKASIEEVNKRLENNCQKDPGATDRGQIH
jgi:hypothetical protein